MQLVEHDALERGEQKRRVVGRQQQRQLFRRGEQDVRRIAPLPLPPRHRRIAGAGLDLDRQPHLGNRRLQIARDVDRERLQRRDVEGVEAAGALHAAAGGDEVLLAAALSKRRKKTAPPASAEIRPASCRRRSARSAARSGRRGPLPAAPADARAATSRAPRTTPEAVGQQRSRFKRREGQGIGRRHARRGKPSEPVRRGLALARLVRGAIAQHANLRRRSSGTSRFRGSRFRAPRNERRAVLLRHRLVGNIPVLAVEDRRCRASSSACSRRACS